MAESLKFSSMKTESGDLFLVIGKTSFVFDVRGTLMAVARGNEHYCTGREISGWKNCTNAELQEYATRFLTADTGDLLRRTFSDQLPESE